MQLICLALLPFCSAVSGSHVIVTLGDSTYSHGNKAEFHHSAPAAASDSSNSDKIPSIPAVAPIYFSPTAVPYSPSHSAPASYHSAPAPYHSASYHPAPIRYLHDPVVVSKPHLHHPVYAHAPVYQAPRQNCSVVTEMTTAEVCTPSFQTTCMPVELMVKKIADKEQCMSITHTVCSETTEVLENEICVYTYQSKSEYTMATNYKVTFEKECQTQMVSVCQPTAGYGYHSYGHQNCKEVEQKTCYNVPMVVPMEEPVTVSYPDPVMNCMQKPISIPRITCEDMTEEKCIMVPETMDVTMMVEKCEVSLGSPSCQMMELTLPKQVCKELVYGLSYDVEQKNIYMGQKNISGQP